MELSGQLGTPENRVEEAQEQRNQQVLQKEEEEEESVESQSDEDEQREAIWSENQETVGEGQGEMENQPLKEELLDLVSYWEAVALNIVKQRRESERKERARLDTMRKKIQEAQREENLLLEERAEMEEEKRQALVEFEQMTRQQEKSLKDELKMLIKMERQIMKQREEIKIEKRKIREKKEALKAKRVKNEMIQVFRETIAEREIKSLKMRMEREEHEMREAVEKEWKDIAIEKMLVEEEREARAKELRKQRKKAQREAKKRNDDGGGLNKDELVSQVREQVLLNLEAHQQRGGGPAEIGRWKSSRLFSSLKKAKAGSADKEAAKSGKNGSDLSLPQRLRDVSSRIGACFSRGLASNHSSLSSLQVCDTEREIEREKNEMLEAIDKEWKYIEAEKMQIKEEREAIEKEKRMVEKERRKQRKRKEREPLAGDGINTEDIAQVIEENGEAQQNGGAAERETWKSRLFSAFKEAKERLRPVLSRICDCLRKGFSRVMSYLSEEWFIIRSRVYED